MSVAWLNARSDFSVGESLARPKELVAAAAKANIPSILLTDTMTVSGMPELFNAAKKTSVKPMIGVRLRIVASLDKEKRPKTKPYFLRAIVLNDQGWRAVLRLLTLSFTEEHFYKVPRLLLSDVLEAARDGGLALTLGDAYSALEGGRARDVIEGCRAQGTPLYADLIALPTPLGERLAKEVLMLQDEGIPTLIAPPALVVEPHQVASLDIMGAIARNMPFDELSARHSYPYHHIAEYGTNHLSRAVALLPALDKRYPGTDWQARIKAAIRTTRDFPATVEFKWEKMEPSLPKMAANEQVELEKLARQSIMQRILKPSFGDKMTAPRIPEYQLRLNHELDVIQRLGFAPYFLLVAEVVNWAKTQGIRVGPGRGSVGGSLIAYALGITDVDPLRFGLLFERFINPERIDLPDADLDFASERREEVVDYIRGRFGDDKVAGVVNYNRLQASGALNDLCRVLKVEGASAAFSKIVPKEHGKSWALSEAIEEVPELAAWAEANPEVIKHALNLEGRLRTFGKHAAGLIVAGEPIVNRAVIERRNEGQVINWDKTLAEEFGLVKLDVLGLSTLDLLAVATAQIRAKGFRHIDKLDDIALDDAAVLAAFGRGETVGVFQFESPGMRRLLRDMASITPLTFEDLAVATALYRPGPMDSGLMDDFVKIRQGLRSESYDHPSMQDALRETKGVMVYQEQVMQVARDFAGFTMPESDHLRKAMGKKDKEKMAGYRDKFIKGAVDLHGVPESLAAEIFDKIAKFAAYGFNKSHAVEYALISYQSMWLKVHHPAEFWAGSLSTIKDDRRSVVLADMKRMGIKLLPPDVNQSRVHYSVLNETTVLAPFGAIKGISDRVAEVVTEARKAGPFASLKDFEARVPARGCNVKQRDLLNRVGAFSRIEPGQLPSDHPDRRRDQMELMPGLLTDYVIVDHNLDVSHRTLVDLGKLVDGYRACEACELKGLCHPKPRLVKAARFMVVVDGPNFKEEAADEMGAGNAADAIDASLGKIGLSLDDAYVTALVKSPKPSKKQWSNKTIAECGKWLDQEIALLKPPVIVILGSLAFKRFFPGLKGGLNEHAGRVTYDKDLDANILVGVNPNAIYYDPGKQTVLDEAISKLADLLPER